MTRTKTKERAADAPILFGDAEIEAPPLPAEPAPEKPTRKNAVARVERIPVAEPQNLLLALMQAVADPKCQPEKVNTLLDARDRLMAQEAHVAFMSAYIEMQDELPTIDALGRIEIAAKREGSKKQSTPYATFQEINRVTKPILKKHKFALLLLPDVGEGGVGVLMRGQLAYVCETQYGKMVHVERCAISAPLETSGSKNNVQGIGSSLSYTKRYAAVALLNLVSHAPEDKDDDGAGGPISEEQGQTIRDLIVESGADIPRFLAYMKVGKIAEIPASKFEDAVAKLQKKKEAKP